MGAKLKQELQAEMTRLKRARSAASIDDSAQVRLKYLYSYQTSMFMGSTGLLSSHIWSSEGMHAFTAQAAACSPGGLLHCSAGLCNTGTC